MNDLETRIAALTDSELLEAASFYLSPDVDYADAEALAGRLSRDVEGMGGHSDRLFEILDRIKDDRVAYRYLLGDVLGRAAHGSDEERERLKEALDGINQNQIVIEILFAIYAASIVTVTWLAIPPTETTTTKTVEHKPDGTRTETTTSTVKEIPPPVKELYGWIKGLVASKPEGA